MLPAGSFTPIANDPGGHSALRVATLNRQATQLRTDAYGPVIEIGHRGNVVTTSATFDAAGGLLVTTAYTHIRGTGDPTQSTGPNDIAALRRAIAAERAGLPEGQNGAMPRADLDRMEAALAAGRFTVVNTQAAFEAAVELRGRRAGDVLFTHAMQEDRARYRHQPGR